MPSDMDLNIPLDELLAAAHLPAAATRIPEDKYPFKITYKRYISTWSQYGYDQKYLDRAIEDRLIVDYASSVTLQKAVRTHYYPCFIPCHIHISLLPPRLPLRCHVCHSSALPCNSASS